MHQTARLSRSLYPLAGLLVVSVLPVAGCSGSREVAPATDAPGSPAAAAATPGIDPASRLDLDSGRVSVFSPTGWRRAPRSYDYLVRYQATPQVPYPSVVVLAADPPADITEVTADSQAAFVEAMASLLAEREGDKLARPPAAASAGPHAGVGWAATGTAKLDGLPKQIERDCLAVVIDGRLYTVEAWAPRGGLDDKARAAARAVAAALRIPSLEPLEGLPPLVPPSEPEAEPEEEPEAEPEAGEAAPEPAPAA